MLSRITVSSQAMRVTFEDDYLLNCLTPDSIWLMTQLLFEYFFKRYHRVFGKPELDHFSPLIESLKNIVSRPPHSTACRNGCQYN